jgi:hypothetical protein
MKHHENPHRWIPDLVQFTTVVVEVMIVHVAIAATRQQPGLAANVLPWSLITYGLVHAAFVSLATWLGQIMGRGRTASEERPLITTDVGTCFTPGGSAAQAWAPASWCPACPDELARKGRAHDARAMRSAPLRVR